MSNYYGFLNVSLSPKKVIPLFLLCLSSIFTLATIAEAQLIHRADLEYVGSFKLPHGDLASGDYKSFSYSKGITTFNPDHGSLFMVGHPYTEEVIELSIPNLKSGVAIKDLNTAGILQAMADVTEGNRDLLFEDQTDTSAAINGTHIGGLLKWGNKLIGSVYAYYSPEDGLTRTHFVSSLDLSVTGDFIGMSKVGNIGTGYYPRAGQIAGYMTKIPKPWQARLGGPALTGMSGLSIISRSSAGSSAFSFDPDEIVDTTSVTAATMLLGYPNGHFTIGGYYDSGTLYHMGTSHNGVVFPAGTDTILYTGRQGMGESCYGPGTIYPEEHGNRYDSPAPNNTCNHRVMTNTADPCCYDLESQNKGSHAYPYVTHAWAYDAHDLERVKNGGRIVDNPSPNLVDSVSASSTETYKPWHIKPYATWEISLPYKASRVAHAGATAYDEVNKLLYIIQPFADGTYPIVNVFHLNIGTNPIFRADVDQSAAIDTADAMLTLRNSLGMAMNATNWKASATTGDVNCDSTSDSSDAMLILRYSLSLDMTGTGWCDQSE